MGNCQYMRRKLASICGRYCGECATYLAKSCWGCGYQLGRTPEGECAIFQCCVVERGLEHCGECLDFACELYVRQASPSQVARTYKALSRRLQIGTIAWLDEQEGEPGR